MAGESHSVLDDPHGLENGRVARANRRLFGFWAGTLLSVRHCTTALALLRASHPLPTLAVTSIAVGLAVTSGRSIAGLMTVGAAVFAGQLSVGWLNDLVDADRDAAVERAGKPVANGDISARAVFFVVLLSASAAVLLSLPLGVIPTAAHVIALVSAWAYDLVLKAGRLSVLPYAVSFGLLPVFAVPGSPANPLPSPLLLLAAGLLGCAAHFANALPDLADDLSTGVRGLPHRLGAAGSVSVAAGAVLAASVLLVLGPVGPMSRVGWATLLTATLVLGIGFLLSRRRGSRAAFHSVMVVALIDVGLLLSASTPTG